MYSLNDKHILTNSLGGINEDKIDINNLWINSKTFCGYCYYIP